MRYSIAAILALASSALAQTAGFAVLTKPATGEKVPAGETYTVVWTPNPKWTGPVTLTLMGGVDNTKLQLLDPIAKGVDGDSGSYEWDVPKSLGKQNIYGIKLSWDEDPENTYQYSFPFSITGGGLGNDDTTSGTAAPTSGSGSASATGSGTTRPIPTSTPSSNISTTARGQSTFSLVPSQTSASTSPTAATTTAATGNAAPTIGSTLALFGGLAMAVFAL
ncbi:hypothetical protein OQA88_4049 [Cercophora sp. LCS_1]